MLIVENSNLLVCELQNVLWNKVLDAISSIILCVIYFYGYILMTLIENFILLISKTVIFSSLSQILSEKYGALGTRLE